MNIEEKKVFERAVLVGLSSPVLEDQENSDYETLDELEELLNTAGGECVAKILQRKDTPDPATFIGEGKTEEVAGLAENNDADLVIFDNDLSPSQIKNLESILKRPVLDRSALILDIFAQRARTSEGRLQVELAQYRYILSKLSGLGNSLSRLGGGIGTRGPGETKLETDRRHIRRHIDRLEEEFERIRRVRGVQREKRVKSEIPLAAIVGYTNAGKSTLLNTLTGAGIEANNRLFDTLDPTTRKLEIDETLTVIFSDTVGFIRKLPHKLVEAFKATLEELEYADVILHVIDLSNPSWESHIKVVERLIEELGVASTPRIRVFNKVDIAQEVPLLRETDVCISAKTGLNIDRLIDAVRKTVSKPLKKVRIKLDYSDASMVDVIYREAKVSSLSYNEDAIVMEVTCNEAQLGKLKLVSYEFI